MEPPELEDFSNKISTMIGFLVRAVTDDPRIKDKEMEYQTLRRQLSAYFSKFNLTDPNPFPTLERFYAFCKVQYARWADRREYIKRMYDPFLTAVNSAIKEGQPAQSIKIITENSRSFICQPIFKSRNFNTDKDSCFVLMPFQPNFERIYKDHIKPTIEKSSFAVIKANDLYTTSAIVEDIWEQINKARLIVADVTGKNANVFYELGIAHTVGKDTVILTQDENDVPFDLRHYRFFKYDDTEQGWKELDECLEQILKAKGGETKRHVKGLFDFSPRR
ncbi:MAG: hypothetical protein NWF05_11830 [Candidatus Bathyarchaeota archaeon]|nr:hypothetical protein [Candidatus Bathyarchaeota archaeon]